jgi:protein Jumonji
VAEPQLRPNPGPSNRPAAAKPEAKPKTIFAKASSPAVVNSPQKEPAGSKSFRVENEASPYAFEPEPAEVRPQMPYRVGASPAPAAHSTPAKNPEPKARDKKPASTSSAVPLAASLPFAAFASEGGPSIGSSIPIPDELAAQLAEQAAAEGAPSGTETTYFIPLSTGTGQSFGVAVKLGTEGPPGPNQKVIMKAKLVTQPVGKTVGARVIGARSTGESTVELASPVQSTSKPTSRMPMASPVSNRFSR